MKVYNQFLPETVHLGALRRQWRSVVSLHDSRKRLWLSIIRLLIVVNQNTKHRCITKFISQWRGCRGWRDQFSSRDGSYYPCAPHPLLSPPKGTKGRAG